MNRQKSHEAIAVMQAFIDGKPIEWKNRNESSWQDLTGNPIWDWYKLEYRVKPQDIYRVYKSPEECFNDLRCDGWIKRKEGTTYYTRISRLDEYVDYQKLFKEYTYADGTPFGIKVN